MNYVMNGKSESDINESVNPLDSGLAYNCWISTTFGFRFDTSLDDTLLVQLLAYSWLLLKLTWTVCAVWAMVTT